MTITGAGARITRSTSTHDATSRVFASQHRRDADDLRPRSRLARRLDELDHGNFGGNVLNRGTLTLSEDWIELGQTTGGSGAGIANVSGTLTVTHSLVAGQLELHRR